MYPLDRLDPDHLRAHLAAIVDSSDDAILSKALDGTILSFNIGAQKLYGYSAEEVVGRSIEVLVPPDRKGEVPDILAKIRRGEVVDHFETKRVTKTGELVDVSLTISPIRDSDGNITAASTIARDITERKRLEAELQAARDEAMTAARLKAEFLANMSHEIRTPMNGILGMTTLLLDTPLTSEQREYVQTLRGSAEALLSIVNDILDFSKIDAGKIELEVVDFALEELVGGVADLLAEQAHDKGLEMVVMVDDDVPPRLRGDAGRLRQVLTNLLANAVKFTERGEVVLKATLTDSSDAGVVVHFEVADTGIGIPPDRQDRLFEAFSQADASTTRTYGGSGLGLAISKRLVELMGGEIGVDSEPGVGSVFWFTTRFGRSIEPDDALPRTGLIGIRALVVEDNESSRRMLDHYLRSWRVRSATVDDASVALASLRAAFAGGEPYDVAVIDADMAGVDGFELARAIATDPALSSTAVLLLTSGNTRRTKAAISPDVGARLAKPIHASDLYAHIAGVTGRGPRPDAGVARLAELTDAGTASGERVLVAEDNPVNQRVTVAMLTKIGYRPDVVANGLEAVDAVERVPYAAVLMDCEMPELDGYDATREIRRREQGARRTPIIAMTASALKGDRERALAAGMDDYISKPTKFEDIAAVLRRWVEAETSAQPGARRGGGNGHIDDAPIDLAVWSELRSLGRDGGADVLREILATFLEEAVSSLSTLRDAYLRRDLRVVHEIAHRLKGSAANVGARRMAAICDALQSPGAGRRPELAASLVEELEAEFERVRVACEQELAARPT